MVNRLDDVVTGALEVLNRYGLEFCSMRRVASQLGVQPSALYHHVPDKQTLLALMADRIVSQVRVDRGEASGDRARQLCTRLRAAMLAVRDGADVVATASAFRLGASHIEQQLREALDDADAARTLLLYVFGHTQATQMQQLASEAGVVTAVEPTDASFNYGVELILAGHRHLKRR